MDAIGGNAGSLIAWVGGSGGGMEGMEGIDVTADLGYEGY